MKDIFNIESIKEQLKDIDNVIKLNEYNMLYYQKICSKHEYEDILKTIIETIKSVDNDKDRFELIKMLKNNTYLLDNLLYMKDRLKIDIDAFLS